MELTATPADRLSVLRLGTGPIPARTLRIEEWGTLEVGGGGDLSVDELNALLAAWESCSGRSPEAFFRFGRNSVQARNWIGVLRTADLQLEVRPRSLSSLSGAEVTQLDTNLQRMIHVAAASVHVTGAGALSGGGQLLDSAVMLLIERTSEALRRDRPRLYRARSEETLGVRGRIDPRRSELRAISRPGVSYSTWVELSLDTPLLRYLKAVLLEARQSISLKSRRRADAFLVKLDDVTTQRRAAEIRPSVSLPRNDLWTQALAIADDIAERRVGGQFVGRVPGMASLVYTAGLFEAFVAAVAEAHFGPRAVSAQHEVLPGVWESGAPKGAAPFFIDLLLHQPTRGRPAAIDTKWKWLSTNRPSLGLPAGDLQQMIAYIATVGGERGSFVVPWVGAEMPSDINPTLRLPSGGTVKVCFVPLASEDIIAATAAALERGV